MYYNVHHDSYNDIIHLWEYVDGKKHHSQHKWVPYVFIPVDVDTETKTIDGKDVTKKTFNTNKDYNAFQKNNHCYENKVHSTIQFLAENYHRDTDLHPPPLHIAYLDIETPHNEGFPTVQETPAPIVLIAIAVQAPISMM